MEVFTPLKHNIKHIAIPRPQNSQLQVKYKDKHTRKIQPKTTNVIKHETHDKSARQQYQEPKTTPTHNKMTQEGIDPGCFHRLPDTSAIT